MGPDSGFSIHTHLAIMQKSILDLLARFGGNGLGGIGNGERAHMDVGQHSRKPGFGVHEEGKKGKGERLLSQAL